MITARERGDGVVVEVSPGGTLRGLTLDERALRLGRHELARRVLELVDKATASANAAALHALADDLADLDAPTLVALGVGQSADATEAAEETTRETWSV